ncbi:MAG TPA: hypothetical protein VFT55_00705 [Planctomycetota bacterium]|nr:hypothetical protein [Planctomycetota bacterium]
MTHPAFDELRRHGTALRRLACDSSRRLPTARTATLLPPGRYFAKWGNAGEHKNVPLGEIAVHPGQTTTTDFVIEPLALRIQVAEADGSPAAGTVVVTRDGWMHSAAVDASGLGLLTAVLRDDPLLVTFRRTAGKSALGQPIFGPAIELGTVRAAGDATPIRLSLPAR